MPHADPDVAMWLNAHVGPLERVAVENWTGYRYLIRADILLNSESAHERQWLKERRGTLSLTDIWRFLVDRGFTYIVIPKDRIDDAISFSPPQLEVNVSFAGRNAAVLKITQNDNEGRLAKH